MNNSARMLLFNPQNNYLDAQKDFSEMEPIHLAPKSLGGESVQHFDLKGFC